MMLWFTILEFVHSITITSKLRQLSTQTAAVPVAVNVLRHRATASLSEIKKNQLFQSRDE